MSDFDPPVVCGHTERAPTAGSTGKVDRLRIKAPVRRSMAIQGPDRGGLVDTPRRWALRSPPCYRTNSFAKCNRS